MNVSSTYANNILRAENTNLGWEYSTIVLAVLFLVSEVLPFVKINGDSITHKIVCLLRGSECVAGKIADTLEQPAILNPV